jgi:hypothetical protein
MKLKLDYENPFWWIWFVTVAFIISAIAGWTPGYYFVMGVSALQVVLFLAREHSATAFPTQIRIAYFALTLIGLWPAVRLYFFAILLLATIMVTFFGRCSLSLVLKQLSWNRGRTARLY